MALVWAVMVDLASSAPLRESFSLEPFAVNLVNAHKATDKVPVLLIRKRARLGGPDQLAGRFWMIGIVNEIAFHSRIR